MNRRALFAAGFPLVLAAGAAQARSPSTAAASAPEKTPLYPDDAQFWFETRRMFGADEYGGASFGEVLGVAL